MIQGLFWRTADLTGQRLSFRQVATELIPDGYPCRSTCDTVWVAYIKLVPLDPGEVEALQSDRKQTGTRRLFATQDWGSGFAWDATEGAIRDQLEAYRHTDFKRIYWEGAAGVGDEEVGVGVFLPPLPEGQESPSSLRNGRSLRWLRLRESEKFLTAGVPYLAFWDSSKTWAVDKIDAGSYQHLRRLGHFQELDAWIQAGEPKPVHASTPLTKVGEWEMTFIAE